jgi:hypothetical protein
MAHLRQASHSVIYVPNAEQVIITSTGKLLPIWTPFQSTDFLSMSFIGTNHALLYWHADIVIVDK